MSSEHTADKPKNAQELELADEDILDAFSKISGYIDISTEDFRTVYHLAWQHAVARLKNQTAVPLNHGDDNAT